jgi:hypothetical protein
MKPASILAVTDIGFSAPTSQLEVAESKIQDFVVHLSLLANGAYHTKFCRIPHEKKDYKII